jgi:hypothetical protein
MLGLETVALQGPRQLEMVVNRAKSHGLTG